MGHRALRLLQVSLQQLAQPRGQQHQHRTVPVGDAGDFSCTYERLSFQEKKFKIKKAK